MKEKKLTQENKMTGVELVLEAEVNFLRSMHVDLKAEVIDLNDEVVTLKKEIHDLRFRIDVLNACIDS